MIKADNYYYTKNITEEVVKNYYSGMKKIMLPFLKEFNIYLNENKTIKINNAEEFNTINTGKYIDIYIKYPKKSNYFVLDLDPGVDVIWGDIKRGTLQLYDFLKNTEKLKKIEIYFTGKNGFKLWCYVKGSERNISDLKKEWLEILEEKFKGNKFHSVANQKPNRNQLNIDFRGFKIGGRYIAPYSIRSETGLICMPIEPNQLSKFSKTDAVLDKIYKKIVGKSFSWVLNKKALTQPLMSNPTYRGNLLEYIEQKQEEDKAKLDVGEKELAFKISLMHLGVAE